MKLAIIGSRGIKNADIGGNLPDGVEEIVSGGAAGVDRLAAVYAREKGIPLTEFLPDYGRYGRGAPLRRNAEIAAYADGVLAFWDGRSRGTAHALALFRAAGKPTLVILAETGAHR